MKSVFGGSFLHQYISQKHKKGYICHAYEDEEDEEGHFSRFVLVEPGREKREVCLFTLTHDPDNTDKSRGEDDEAQQYWIIRYAPAYADHPVATRYTSTREDEVPEKPGFQSLGFVMKRVVSQLGR